MAGQPDAQLKSPLPPFKQWVFSSENEVLWAKSNQQQFNHLWSSMLDENQPFEQSVNELKLLITLTENGPLAPWATWLQERFIIHAFISNQLSLQKLSEKAGISISSLATLIREFLVQHFPNQKEQISRLLQVGSILSSNRHLLFNQFPCNPDKTTSLLSTSYDNLVYKIELTASDSWDPLYQQAIKKIAGLKEGKRISRKRFSNIKSNKPVKALLEVILLLIIGVALMSAVKQLNIWYEKYLINKISIYEPQLLWLDKELTFKPAPTTDDTIDSSPPPKPIDIDMLAASRMQIDTELKTDVERSGTESEVILTSLQTLPRNFGAARMEQSDYEESTQGGYRDTRYGRKKVYRIMVKTIDPELTINKINFLLKKYSITAVGEVRPGIAVPGGFYFNLFAPKLYVKEFLTEVKGSSDSVIFESRARGRTPPGKEHVFIWVKSI